MWEQPTMSIKTNDLFWLSHDVYEKTRLIITVRRKSARIRMEGKRPPNLGMVAR